ncbi:hypothetical protein Cycma_3194 [Cyclobacterium marinum DSM 745]|uniref:Uncharacterized protein n=1 Tax=Cyclobacterium marinum (strain ATCC 25205 / DSM 745 / LMG 13164 / NCIMB 1802) TaxID=880070 RepID=G0J731_CYCMS|nr:hypothetical protein Cycma_3194 [Cyclobacterium marinum DSM 745]|tara:strand:+ start:974 stop:1141 length:168 start_codon:yes stop_codon:yes gene_type:complete
MEIDTPDYLDFPNKEKGPGFPGPIVERYPFFDQLKDTQFYLMVNKIFHAQHRLRF